MILSYLLLISGLSISAIAEYYSIMGLMAIFSASPIPIAVMGISLGVAKLVMASWVKQYWARIPSGMKAYGVTAVVILMLITTIGCFGFLSKAHNDQNLVSGDVGAKLAIYDEKIRTSKDNIDANRKALKQMDEAVDQVMARSSSEAGANQAVGIRRSQQKERTRLQSEIQAEQKTIASLSEEAAPVRAEVRKVEAEVGPIKYIAAFLYGTAPDAGMLEQAVTWIIILIVIVFDPLAVIMLLASQMTFAWHRKENESTVEEQIAVDTAVVEDAEPTAQNVTTESTPTEDVDLFAYLKKPFVHFSNLPPMPAKREVIVDEEELVRSVTEEEVMAPFYEEDDGPLTDDQVEQLKRSVELFSNRTEVKETFAGDGVNEEQFLKDFEENLAKGHETASPILTLGIDEVERPGDYVTPPAYTGPMKEIVEEHIDENTRVKTFNHTWVPDLDAHADNIDRAKAANADFGTKFPDSADKGDMYLRVDFLPARLFKFNGVKWIEVDKAATDSYTYNEEYIKYLIDKINSGEYDVDTLSDGEQEQIREYLKNK